MMENNSEKVTQKKYKITDPEIIRAILFLIPLFFIFFAKYFFVKNEIIQKYFSGLSQVLLIILWFGIAWIIKKMIQNKKVSKKQ